MASQTPARGSLGWVKYRSPTSAPPYGGSTWRRFAYQAFSELTPIYSEALLMFSALLRQICSRPFYGGIMQKSCSLKHLTLAVLLQQVITTMNILKFYKRLISTCSVRLNVNFISRMNILVQNLSPKLNWTMWCNWYTGPVSFVLVDLIPLLSKCFTSFSVFSAQLCYLSPN